MSESLGKPIHTTTGYGRIDATWFDSTATWMCDYFPNPNPDYEALQLARRTLNLTQRFEQYKLLAPTVEILGDVSTEQKFGGQLLRVTTLLMPYVDPAYIRPVVELRQPAPTEQAVEEVLVLRNLRAGGDAIYNYFASAMTPRR